MSPFTPETFIPVDFGSDPFTFTPVSFAPGPVARIQTAASDALEEKKSTSRQVMIAAVQQGLLSAERSQQLWDKAIDACDKTLNDVEEMRRENKTRLDATLKILQNMEGRMKDHVEGVFKKGECEALDQKDWDQCEFLFRVWKNTIDQAMAASTQWIHLQDLAHQQAFGLSEKAINFLFSKRVEEIEWLSQAASVVQGQETHQHRIEVEKREALLKEESQAFAQMIDVVKLRADLSQKKTELGLKEKDQKETAESHRAELELKKTALKGNIAFHFAQLRVDAEEKEKTFLETLDGPKRIAMLNYKIRELES